MIYIIYILDYFNFFDHFYILIISKKERIHSNNFERYSIIFLSYYFSSRLYFFHIGIIFLSANIFSNYSIHNIAFGKIHDSTNQIKIILKNVFLSI